MLVRSSIADNDILVANNAIKKQLFGACKPRKWNEKGLQ
jgi:hypothetical protein